jgi:hypothetical protein
MSKSIQFHMRALILVIVLLVFPYISFAGQLKVVRVYDGDTLQTTGHRFLYNNRMPFPFESYTT